MKTDNKTIAMIESIPSFDTYSKYSDTLSRMFKYSSLKNLLHSLKHPRHFIDKEFSQFTQSISPDKRHSIQFDINAFEKSLSSHHHNIKRTRNKTDIHNININTATTSASAKHLPLRNNNNNNHKRKLPPLNDIPDPCHYNPNYNAIYRRIPSVIISHTVNTVNNSCNKQSTITYDNNNNNNTTTNGVSSRSPSPKKRKVFDTEISESTTTNALLPPVDYFGKNHALKFELYPSRKSMVVPAKNDKVSYLEPIDYLKQKNKAVDFKKMKQRGVFDLIHTQQLHTPGINYYKPKYNVIEKNAPMISFRTRNNVPELTKEFKVKQLWKSYDVFTEYQIVKECNEINKEGDR